MARPATPSRVKGSSVLEVSVRAAQRRAGSSLGSELVCRMMAGSSAETESPGTAGEYSIRPAPTGTRSRRPGCVLASRLPETGSTAGSYGPSDAVPAARPIERCATAKKPRGLRMSPAADDDRG